MYHGRKDMHVTLSSSSATIFTERFFLGEFENQVFDIMYVVRVARITNTSAVLYIGVVSAKIIFTNTETVTINNVKALCSSIYNIFFYQKKLLKILT